MSRDNWTTNFQEAVCLKDLADYKDKVTNL